jgi:diadenosine tetraphosphate (Ap4A) HIT family hydrolase
VRQFHVHVIVRFPDDAAGAFPVWGAVPPRAYDEAELGRLVAALRGALGRR